MLLKCLAFLSPLTEVTHATIALLISSRIAELTPHKAREFSLVNAFSSVKSCQTYLILSLPMDTLIFGLFLASQNFTVS